MRAHTHAIHFKNACCKIPNILRETPAKRIPAVSDVSNLQVRNLDIAKIPDKHWLRNIVQENAELQEVKHLKQSAN
jgi:hypothetical protein